ncbi:uracil DNA glycosylase superfamily protein [Clostridium homopropionicum DSM 5847]|uniref:Type-4 uracil-DNA glycosylase n=1 Tax=Clostridium homopropionicum DSM 5847 TaxID=1121318 RepID=A0A0L6Z7K8_9CLOT|nr:uracil-DNA glycosylase [Clostridium homopropionicum]KOA18949.1 uracil DNA glycosylase superfamily protein [Clostridium homopropionicum DSM 5847]SFG43642.1 DNA polymerase [Clostridium homopropionicum]
MLQWRELYNQCCQCKRCELGNNRINMVFGEGNPKAKLLFVGEAPGADEDKSGRPFVGRAGQLLEKALKAVNLIRGEDFYIANVCKCRPENNRTPKEDEAQACLPYLRNQVALIKPKIIICLGAVSSKYIIGEDFKITRDRGKWFERKGVQIMATFHPAALFRDESKKALFWEDIKEIKKKYDALND